MSAQVTNHKCPSCNGPLRYDGASGSLVCDYCGGTYSVSEIEALYAQDEAQASEAFQQAQQAAQAQQEEQAGEDWDTSGLEESWGSDGEGMRSYICPSCNAELLCDATTAATSCPYCGNPTVVPGQFSGAWKPDLVIPFRLDKDAAVAALKNHYKGKRFLPRAFSEENHIRKLQGIYVPFWLFDGVADADATFDATRTHVHRSGDTEVTTTEHYLVRRAGSMAFEKVPVDSSSKMPDSHMDSIEPYDYTGLKPFSTAYLPGFLADKYDVSLEECAKRANERCAQSALDALRGTVSGYATCTLRSKNVRLKRGKVHYALMPVWLLSTQWQGENFLFAMNGQTGKLVGDLPVDWGRFWGMFAKIAVPLAAVGSLIGWALL